MTRVEIAAGGHQVTIEATDPLTIVTEHALILWLATDSPNTIRGADVTGFVTENSAATYTSEARSPYSRAR